MSTYRSGERWDRDRFSYERDRDRRGDERVRYEEDDRSYSRGGAPPVMTRPRGSSIGDRFDRMRVSGGDVRYGGGNIDEDDDRLVIRERRTSRYDDDGPSRRGGERDEVDRRIIIERDRERIADPEPPPPPRQRPGMIRRQSSLDTFDRQPRRFYYERDREDEYDIRARREEYRPRAYEQIPLPRSRGLPPPRMYAERDYDEIRISEPDRYGDEEYRMMPERVVEKEYVREKVKERERSPSPSAASTVTTKTARTSRTGRSRSSHHHSHHERHHSSHRSSSRTSVSSSSSSSSSSSGGTAVASEYPKKGKTRIPARLCSTRALIDLGYPFVEEGNVVVVLKALGQENIDDVLKLSESYLKNEEIITAASSSGGGEVIEARREEVIMAPEAEVIKTSTVVRDISPARSAYTSTTGTSVSNARGVPVIVDARPDGYSNNMNVGPLAVITDRHRSRSRSVNNREVRAEIKALERQLAREERHSQRGEREVDRDIVRAERLSTGELILYEERIEKIEEPRKGVRLEKDKRGPPRPLVKAMLATLT